MRNRGHSRFQRLGRGVFIYLVIAILALAVFGHGPLAAVGTKVLVIVLLVVLVFKLPGIIAHMVRPRKNI